MLTEIATGKQPRRDYLALQQELGAEVIYPDDALTIPLGRLIRRLFGARIVVAFGAFRSHRAYDYILATPRK